MKKKIGILTFHNVPNYGAVLQAFALKTYLQNRTNTNVEIIDFQCKGNSDEFEPNKYFSTFCTSNNIIKGIIKKILVGCFAKKKYRIKHNKFCDFVKYQLHLSPYTTEIYKNYSYIFCGSDQIWNYDITNGYQLPYFGADRADDDNATVVAYAASCGDINDYDEAKKKDLYKLVGKMDYVGVREKTLAEELNKQNIKAINTLDPTFLLSRNDYVQALKIEPKAEKKYVLEYSLRKSKALDDVAAKIAREKNISVIKVCGYINMVPEKGVFDAGPTEFLELLASAEYVVTNSFHGTALSIIFEKDFNVVLPPLRKGRITDLLAMLSLTERICDNTDNAISKHIDYGCVENVLKEQVDSSRQFIDKIIGTESLENE